MASLKDYKEAIIKLSTLSQLHLVSWSNHSCLFEVKYNVSKYEENNMELWKRNPKIFRNDHYTFYPNDNIIMSLPYSYIDKLKIGVWTRNFPGKWKKKLWMSFKKNKSNTIHSLSLVWILKETCIHGTRKNKFTILVSCVY